MVLLRHSTGVDYCIIDVKYMFNVVVLNNKKSLLFILLFGVKTFRKVHHTKINAKNPTLLLTNNDLFQTRKYVPANHSLDHSW